MEYLLYRLAVGLLGPVSDEISFSRADNGAMGMLIRRVTSGIRAWALGTWNWALEFN